METTELKRLKEEFVSNLEGTTMLEISSVAMVTVVAIFFRMVLAVIMNEAAERDKKATQSHPGRSGVVSATWLSTALDFCIIVVPMLYCMTHPYAIWPFILLLTAGAALLVVVASTQGKPLLCFPCPSKNVQASIASSRKPFLTKYRASMMLLTVTAILAVDFSMFPRRFVKAETFGTGLMDVGVGSFVVANGVVSCEARGSPIAVGNSLRKVSPLLLLALGRLVATKGTGYQEHVGEYGVHWNFFFTLAAVELVTSAVRVPPERAALFGALIISAYQAVLSKGGLSELLMSNQRGESLVSQNKEGIASVCGYWALYLLSVQLGRYLTTSATRASLEASKKGDLGAKQAWWRLAGKAWALQLLLWTGTVGADRFVERVSRRSCNLAYVLWMLAFNLQAISMFLSFDLLLPLCSCRMLDAIDFNLLPVFLLGNVLTGLVNMSMNTLETSQLSAFMILLSYIGLITLTAVGLYQKRVRLKAW